LTPYLVSIGFMIGYWVFLSNLADKVNDGKITDAQWNRYVYLVNGVEAIVFAAAGFLFGREVNRQRAENAETQLYAAHQHEVQAVQEMTSVQNSVRNNASQYTRFGKVEP